MSFITPTQARERITQSLAEQASLLLKSIESVVISPSDGFIDDKSVIKYRLNDPVSSDVLDLVIYEMKNSGWRVDLVTGMGRPTLELRIGSPDYFSKRRNDGLDK